MLKENLNYSPETGVFMWIKPRVGRNVGVPLEGRNRRGYLKICIDGVNYYGHRLAWLYETGEHPLIIDHIDENKSNNRFSNLSNGTISDNMKNVRRKKPGNKSGVVGVCWDKAKNKWRVQVYHNCKLVVNKRFDSFHKAVAVRKAAEVAYGYRG